MSAMSPEQAFSWMTQVIEDYGNTLPSAVRVAFASYANVAVPIVQARLRDVVASPSSAAPAGEEGGSS